MSKNNPLAIPEILLSISRFLKQTDVVSCLCVCKLWRQVFLPAIWSNVSIFGGLSSRPPNGPSVEYLHQHRSIVRILHIYHNHFGIFTATYPNLHTLTLKPIHVTNDCVAQEDDPFSLVSQNPTLVNLSLKGIEGFLTASFWRSLSGLSRLTSLHISFTSLSHNDDIDAFWAACSNLQSLQMSRVKIPTSSDAVQKIKFSKMRFLELDLVRKLEFQGQLDLIRQCPNLEELVWNFMITPDQHEVFTQDITQGIWPNLEKLSFVHFIPDENSSRLLSKSRRVTKLDMSYTEFGPHCFNALRTHFNTITILHLYKCLGVTSIMLQEAMCSIPHLVELKGDYLNAKDIVDNGLWVCHSLKKLHVCILFNEVEQELQPKIYERLSTLTRLEELRFGDWTNGTIRPLPQTLDLRLKSGLGLLSKLKNIRMINTNFSEQSMDQDDIQWMINNWRQLEMVMGTLNQHTPDFNRLTSMLQAHGIKCSKVKLK